MLQMDVWSRMTASTLWKTAVHATTEENSSKKRGSARTSLSPFGLPTGQNTTRKRAERKGLPSRITTRIAARVALQRCPILRAGNTLYHEPRDVAKCSSGRQTSLFALTFTYHGCPLFTPLFTLFTYFHAPFHPVFSALSRDSPLLTRCSYTCCSPDVFDLPWHTRNREPANNGGKTAMKLKGSLEGLKKSTRLGRR